MFLKKKAELTSALQLQPNLLAYKSTFSNLGQRTDNLQDLAELYRK